MAAQRNKQPLPDLSNKPGLIIPSNSLLGPSYQLQVPPNDELPAADSQPSSIPPQNGNSKLVSKPPTVINLDIRQPMDMT